MLSAGPSASEHDIEVPSELPPAYIEALARTNAAIDPEAVRSRDPAELRARAEQRLGRLRTLLSALGDPHLAYGVIHVAGTSGKGSTALLAASMLQAAGYRTGLHTSPYLQVATEKAQIDGRMLAPDRFRTLVDDVISASERAGLAPVTYGEIWFALAALGFARESVEFAVFEVGAGGRFDLTNVVRPAVSVITSVGFDHMETLGSTLAEIGWHKAGIIKPGIPAVTAVTSGDARLAIEREAVLTGSPLQTIAEGVSYETRDTGGGTFVWWDREQPGIVYPTAMPGRFQAANAALALAAVRVATGRRDLDPAAIQMAIRRARMPGRFEIMQEHPFVILDGAHNPEKMAAFAGALSGWLTAHDDRCVVGVIGALEAKAAHEMFAPLLRHLDVVICTQPAVLAKKAATPVALGTVVHELGFAGQILIESEPHEAVARAISLAGHDGAVVVTGSLYLVGNVRGRWYSDATVLATGDSFALSDASENDQRGFRGA